MTAAALWAWFAALPWGTMASGLVMLLWERWLGRTSSTPASNTIDLLIHLWQYGHWGPSVPKPPPATKGEEKVTMTSSKNLNARSITVDVDGPTADLLAAINDVVTKVAAGAKPADVAQQSLGQVFMLMQELGKIPADAKADPASVERAIALGLADLGEAIRAHLGVTNPPPIAPGK